MVFACDLRPQSLSGGLRRRLWVRGKGAGCQVALRQGELVAAALTLRDVARQIVCQIHGQEL
jgi:hypothetical protein